jgi:bacteriorhodopsin
MFILVFGPFRKYIYLVLSCVSSLDILVVSLLSDIANIFSQSVSCLFILFIIYFAVYKVSSLT